MRMGVNVLESGSRADRAEEQKKQARARKELGSQGGDRKAMMGCLCPAQYARLQTGLARSGPPLDRSGAVWPACLHPVRHSSARLQT